MKGKMRGRGEVGVVLLSPLVFHPPEELVPMRSVLGDISPARAPVLGCDNFNAN